MQYQFMAVMNKNIAKVANAVQSSVNLNGQVAKIDMNSGSQLSEL